MEKETNNPFRQPGIVLLVVGILDIGVMAYCIANKIYYSSSLNIFAVIAGILLIRGSVKTARFARWFIVFLFTAAAGLVLVLPIMTPIELLTTQMKTASSLAIWSLLIAVVYLGVLVWVYLRLSSESALNLLAKAGYRTGKPTSAIAAGAIILVLVVGSTYVFLNGELAEKAKSLAQRQVDGDYKFHVSSISTTNDSGRATVKAYNSSEVREIEVRW